MPPKLQRRGGQRTGHIHGDVGRDGAVAHADADQGVARERRIAGQLLVFPGQDADQERVGRRTPRDVGFVAGGDTMRNGYPGYVSGASFAQALGWTGVDVASTYGACATGVQALDLARAQILSGKCDVAIALTPKDATALKRRLGKSVPVVRILSNAYAKETARA